MNDYGYGFKIGDVVTSNNEHFKHTATVMEYRKEGFLIVRQFGCAIRVHHKTIDLVK
jgi:hypothetical protein